MVLAVFGSACFWVLGGTRQRGVLGRWGLSSDDRQIGGESRTTDFTVGFGYFGGVSPNNWRKTPGEGEEAPCFWRLAPSIWRRAPGNGGCRLFGEESPEEGGEAPEDGGGTPEEGGGGTPDFLFTSR